jgi:hypothetical protein
MDARSRAPRQPGEARSVGADERHLFVVFPGFADAPFAETYLLMRPEAPSQTIPPDLPQEVTHIWAAGNWDSGDGMRWSPVGGWERFDNQLRPTGP